MQFALDHVPYSNLCSNTKKHTSIFESEIQNSILMEIWASNMDTPQFNTQAQKGARFAAVVIFRNYVLAISSSIYFNTSEGTQTIF